MKYMISNANTGWFKGFEGSEDEAIKETERISMFHGNRYSLHDEQGRLIGATYVPEPVYVFLKG
jgi:hypothetical protein